MRKVNIQRMCQCGLLSALICVLTLFPRIALPSGYVHLGDGLILLSVELLGPWSILAAAVGSMLADLLAFPAYALATLLIKGLMAATAWLLLRKGAKTLWMLLAFVAAEAVMVGGYFLFERLFFPEYALVDVIGNVVQGFFGVMIGMTGQRLLPRIRKSIHA